MENSQRNVDRSRHLQKSSCFPKQHLWSFTLVVLWNLFIFNQTSELVIYFKYQNFFKVNSVLFFFCGSRYIFQCRAENHSSVVKLLILSYFVGICSAIILKRKSNELVIFPRILIKALFCKPRMKTNEQ